MNKQRREETTAIPIGEEEGPELEFKAAAALDDLFRVGREIVGMLNYKGGRLWVGLAEEQDRAAQIDPVPDPDRQRGRLHDFIVDSIEPVPEDDEVGVVLVEVGDGNRILRIDISPQRASQPYALLRKGGHHYPVRIGSRLRALSRREIAERFAQAMIRAGGRGTARTDAVERLLRRRDEHRGSDGLLWMTIWPLANLDLDLSGDEWYERLLMEPELSENRRDCYLNFTTPYERPTLGVAMLSQGGVSLHDDGRIEAKLRLSEVVSPLAALAEEPTNEIHPLAFLEYSTSILRLSRAIFRRRVDDGGLRGEDRVLADLALFGVSRNGWTLRPGSPGSLGDLILHLRESRDAGQPQDPDIAAPQPLTFRVAEVVETPDRCAHRLIKRIYAGFGYPERDVPREFDREAGRVSFMPPLRDP